MNLEQAYNKLSSKLPPYQEFVKAFPLSADPEKLTVKEVGKAVRERLEEYAKYLEGVLEPDTTIASMTEGGVFSNDERKDLLETYKHLMHLDRSLIVAILEGEEATIKQVTEAVKEWQRLQGQVKKALLKMMESWEQETDSKVEELYFG